MYEMPIDNHPEGKSIRFKAHPHITGRDGGRTINLRKLALEGVTLYGRLADIEGNTLFFDDDLNESLLNADNADAKMKKTIDEFIEKNGIDAPEDNNAQPSWEPDQFVSQIDLLKEKIYTVIWATGYKYDFSWIEIPVFDERGYPIYERGVTDKDGLYFVGLHWLHTWGSGLFYSVGQDAEHIVNHLTSN
jgi:putative flavoprotein involved in K+ transport